MLVKLLLLLAAIALAMAQDPTHRTTTPYWDDKNKKG